MGKIHDALMRAEKEAQQRREKVKADYAELETGTAAVITPLKKEAPLAEASTAEEQVELSYHKTETAKVSPVRLPPHEAVITSPKGAGFSLAGISDTLPAGDP